MAKSQITYEDFLQVQDEVMRRAKAIQGRLDRLEFTTGPLPPTASDGTITAIAAMYAALAGLIELGIPLSLVCQLTGFMYMVGEDLTRQALWEAIRNHLLLHTGGKETVN